MPPSRERIHWCAANLGHPWLRLAVQQPKLGSRPKTLESGPLVFQGQSSRTLHSTWFTCWSYWCAHMSGEKVAGSALKAMRSSRSAAAGSPSTPTSHSSE